MAARIIYLGAPEADARTFEARARSDFPGIPLLATNDRTEALRHLAGAEAIIGHHFQFDEAMLGQARDEHTDIEGSFAALRAALEPP